MKESNPGDLVFVAMSGGVDSSLAALLLKEQGYNVVGATLKLWEHDVDSQAATESVCCTLESINDARTVCYQIGAAHYVFDFRREFENHVISNFTSEYQNGRTPYPCAICNRQIKWKALWQKISGLGGKFIATGHYARVRYDKTSDRFQILKGKDSTKDQSYALWGLSQKDLSQTLFPLGEMTKAETRTMARKYNLKTAGKPDSQELCFIPNDDLAGFFKKRGNGSVRPGPIFKTTGEVLGEHKGLPFYTVGQRKGIGIAAGKPLYVSRIDPSENSVYLDEGPGLLKTEFTISNLNWVSISAPVKEIACQLKLRYQHKPVGGTIFPAEEGISKVVLDQPEKAITPGQSAVFYSRDILWGGGIIEKIGN
ncbi:MAG: tRNA 2-thiouridine(34) synthase MnmA [candidate division Zixibacteria bacterium]|nr:tRNA 2-thiouridine(34) synthase MnmA [candidate division Zixibacteria bacterium]